MTEDPCKHPQSLPPILLIAGPTASGKSALALDLAAKLDGVIINVDSMQVYADLRLLTARPSVAEEALTQHYLYGHVDGAINYSVAHYLSDVKTLLNNPDLRHKTLIFVGGTGLYFKALQQGLVDVPTIPDALRTRLRHEAQHLEASQLHTRLIALDPVMGARLKPCDKQRILRALEVKEATGRSLSEFQKQQHDGVFSERLVHAFFLVPERAALIERINQRFDHMITNGALEEVEHLAARLLDPALPIMRAHGVPWLMKSLIGTVSYDHAVERAKIETRQYAKRQMTWWRHTMPDWTFYSATDPSVLFMQILQRINTPSS